MHVVTNVFTSISTTFMQSMNVGQDVDQRASQARSSIICATVALVFGLLATIAVVVYFVYREKKMHESDY